MKRKSIREISLCAVIGALYAACSMVLSPISFGPVQFRLGEALTLLPFFFPGSVWGLTVGCVLANLLSPYGVLDVILGSAATCIAGILTAKMKNRWLAPLPVIFVNAMLVAPVQAIYAAGNARASLTLFALYAAQIAASEAAVTYLLGQPLLFALEKTGIAEKIGLNRQNI